MLQREQYSVCVFEKLFVAPPLQVALSPPGHPVLPPLYRAVILRGSPLPARSLTHSLLGRTLLLLARLLRLPGCFAAHV